MSMANDSRVHEKPPAKIKDLYKVYQKLNKSSLDQRSDLLDSTHSNRDLKPSTIYSLPPDLRQKLLDFLSIGGGEQPNILCHSPQVFEIPSLPGLFLYPSLLPPNVQISLLDRMLHRDLCNPQHKTNVHLHHEVPYPRTSFFDASASDLVFQPKDPTIHKPLATKQFLDKKLRWMTLGGQYDWTQKVYPSGPPPAFPSDIKGLIEDIFPMKAEAAIVNLYSPGDTLSLHRDVSEECGQPLVSISVGCDGIFTVGLDSTDGEGEPRIVTIRLRSGDAVLMSGESRFAWHGVPKVLEGTCPGWLENWPFVEGSMYERWRGWMKGKRINLNVRQMFD